MRIQLVGLVMLVLVFVLFAASCSKGPTVPPPPPQQEPQTELTFAPVQYDTTTFRVHFYWNGYDDDGEVMRFHYAVDADTVLPINQWRTTTAKDTTLLFLVDPVKELAIHVFKISAEDNDGKWDKTPASRAFSAKTLPPVSKIERGPSAFNPIVGPNFTFEWSGIDPDGGETGGKVPVDTFQYLLLHIGGVLEPATHDPLPTFDPDDYTDMINASVGDTLANWTFKNGGFRRIGDWSWIGIRALKHRFKSQTPGEYVFAERAVDIAGATEKFLRPYGRNIRHFSVSSSQGGPQLCVTSSILNRPLECATGPVDFVRKQLQIFEGETVSFSWIAHAEAYGGEIVGYTYALDDTSSFPGPDIRTTGATFQPSVLPPGNHFLYVRAQDDGGLISNAVIPLLIVHPAFKDPGAQHTILFVDDSVPRLGNGSGPDDATETDWWTLGPGGVGPLFSLGVPYTEWDTFEQGANSVEGRKQPAPADLAPFTTVVWTTDAENGGSVQTALFKTVAGGDYSELQGYLRAGGTLILTGWKLAQNTSGVANLTFKKDGPAPNGMCATFAPGSGEYLATTFPRMYMGIDNSLQGQEALRTQGFADFVRGIPTPAGVAFGFDTARVDTGSGGIGTYKWNTNSTPPPFNLDQQLFPGIAGIEGWYLPRNFGCQAIQNFGFENPAAPIVQVIYTYHGVNMGPLQDQGPSPREGLAVASLVQSHDLGTNAGRYVYTAAIGRIAFFTFPLYFLKDADAINIMVKSFQYVDTSPTLP
jgi:hypothetical protein